MLQLHQHEDDDENKVPDLSRTKLVHVLVLVLGKLATFRLEYEDDYEYEF